MQGRSDNKVTGLKIKYVQVYTMSLRLYSQYLVDRMSKWQNEFFGLLCDRRTDLSPLVTRHAKKSSRYISYVPSV